MPSNPLLPQELLLYIQASAQNGIVPPNLPSGYVYATPPTSDGHLYLRRFDAAYIQTGIIDPNRLGTGATGAGNLYLADDGTWKAVGGGGGVGTLDQVTNLGNTTTNTIDIGGVKSDYFLLDTLATPTPQAGMMFWDQDSQTPDIQLDAQLAGRVFQDEFWYVKNQTGSQINKGTVVRAVGTLGASSRILVAPMVADGSVPAKYILGIAAENIPDGADGSVMRAGKIRQLNTSMYAAGDILYANPAVAGGLTATLPEAPNLKLAVAFVVHAAINGVLAVRVEVGSDLYEDHRVQVTTGTLATGQLLRYNATNTRWENWTPNFLTSVPTLAQVTTAGNTTTNAITIGGLTVGSNFLTTDTANNQLLLNSGTAGNPSLSFIGDSNTGIFRSATNALGISVDGVVYDFNPTEFSTGRVRIRRSVGSASEPMIALSNSLGGDRSGLYYVNNGTSNLRIAVNSADVITIPSTGNILIGTTTDAGYKLDVNGIARVVTRIDAGTFTPGAGASAYTFATTGRITAAGGYNLRSPIFGDSAFSGLADNSGPTIYNNNTAVVRFNNIGSALNGTNINILQTYNPGAGTGSVVGVRHSYALYPSVDNTVSYTSFSAGPYWLSPSFYNRITGPIRGFYFGNGLYNTQKLVDVIAFQSEGGRVLFEGEVPSASAGISRGVYINQTHTAAANNDVLVGLDINPTFTNGAFTGVQNLGLRVQNSNILLSSSKGIYFGTSGYGITGEVGIGSLSFYTNSAERLKIDNAGVITANGNARFAGIGLTGSNIELLNGLWYFNIENDGNGLQVKNVTGSNAVPLRIFKNNNITIGTTTDAGYKLDVNGTARISDTLTVSVNSTNTFVLQNPNFTQGRYRFIINGDYGLQILDNQGYGISLINNAILLNSRSTNGTINIWSQASDITRLQLGGQDRNPTISRTRTIISPVQSSSVAFTPTSGTAIDYSFQHQGNSAFQPNSGNALFTQIELRPTFNTTGTYSGIVRGLYYNPVLTSITGVTHRAIETVTGNVIFGSTSGNVLIGTTTDAGYKLDVNGSTRVKGVGTTDSTIAFLVQNNTGRLLLQSDDGGSTRISGPTARLYVGVESGGATHRLVVNGSGLFSNGGIGNAGGFYIDQGGTSSASRTIWYDGSGSPKNLITGNGNNYITSGNFGIGTPTPTDIFHIVNNTNGNKFGRISAGGSDASAAWVAQNDQVDNVVYRVFGSGVSGTQMGIALARSASLLANLGGSGKFLLGTYSNTDFVMGTGNAEKMRIVDSTGNVLIATTTDLGNKLEVSGSINSTGYKINNTAGYTGILVIVTNPPGQQNVDIQSGIIVNVF